MFQPATWGAGGETEALANTIVAFRAARQARPGKRLGLGLCRYGEPLSQKIYNFVSLSGTQCPLSVYILLNFCPREILPRGTVGFPRRVASGPNQGGALSS